MTCLICWRRRAIVERPRSRSGSVPKLLFSATCLVKSASSELVGTGNVAKPAFSVCRTYWFAPEHPRQLPGLGPGIDLALTTKRVFPSALTLTEVGYQAVGIRPRTLLLPFP